MPDVEDDGSDTKAADEAEALYKQLVGDKQTAEAEEVEEEDFEHEAFDRDAARKLGADLARRIGEPHLGSRNRRRNANFSRRKNF